LLNGPVLQRFNDLESNRDLGAPPPPALDPAAAPWDSEPRQDCETMQPLPFQYSSTFRPKYLIDNPERKPILLPAVFKGG